MNLSPDSNEAKEMTLGQLLDAGCILEGFADDLDWDITHDELTPDDLKMTPRAYFKSRKIPDWGGDFSEAGDGLSLIHI